MAFKFKKVRSPVKLNLPSLPDFAPSENSETLLGSVNGLQASAPEERLATALKKAGVNFEFRLTVGAPRGLPGWKELDFVVRSGGLLYAVEVDTAFTHRQKENADVLHDAIILNDRYLQTMGQFYPAVMHVDGDSDLANIANARAFVKRTFRPSGSTYQGSSQEVGQLFRPPPPVIQQSYTSPAPQVPVEPVRSIGPDPEDEARKQKNARTIAQRAARSPVRSRK